MNEQEQIRLDKLNRLSEHTHPYPDRYEFTHELKDAKNLEDGAANIAIVGRITFMRKMGRLSFVRIQDFEGSMQLSIQAGEVSEDTMEFFKDYIDIGDFIGAKGTIFTTKTGEKTLKVKELEFLGKALKPLPEKFHGLVDTEIKYRERYLDLIMNDEARKTFMIRIKFIQELREYLNHHGYFEIETPILLNEASGALAKPFITHHNALDISLYLRIAPETYLKRAVIGGMNSVFEIARCFRNEGIDSTHLQDFTMIEGYRAYYNFEDNMTFLREMLQTIIQDIFGTLEITIENELVDLSGIWPKVSFRDLILKYTPIDIKEVNTKEKLLQAIKENNIELDSDTPIENLGFGNMVDYLYKKVARPHIKNPIYLTEHPLELSPLARQNDDDKSIVDRFQLVINGAEIINGYSELVDPFEQRRRLDEQARLKEGGDEEAMAKEEDYLQAMAYGMPPISGWGMGIDRMVQLLTNSDNIKDVVMFPLMRPNHNSNKKD